jgi:serine/threonine protein kinase
MSKANFREYHQGEAIRNGDRVYFVEERIAHGKFGYTFACRDGWGNPLILRVLWPFSRSYQNVREKWPQQIQEVRQVQHPSLVQILDSFEHEGFFHLVLERCDHRLEQFVLSPSFDGSRWLRAVARPVLCALDHLHRAGYTHKNLHPHNVLTTVHLELLHPGAVFSGAIRLADFGENVLLGNVDILNAKVPRWLVPPEYLNPSEFGAMDHRVDIYQAGLLFLCLLQGRITRYSFEEIATGLPLKNAEKLESGFGTAISRALALKVQDRFPSALEFWNSLNGTA